MEFNIESIKRKMLVKYPFFGSVVANVNYKENKGISTAGTDGTTIYYNPAYLKKLNIDEQMFIFTHEVCHIAFNHIYRSEGKDPTTWNTATDAVINAFLKQDGLKLAEGVADIAEAINYDAEQFYNKLIKEKQQHQQQEQKDNQNQSDSNIQDEQQGQSQQQSSKGQSDGQQHQQQSSSENSNENKNLQGSEQNGQSSGQSNSSQEETKNKDGTSAGSEQSSNKEGQQENHDVGHDTHSMWEEAIKKQKEKREKSQTEDKKDSLENQKEDLEEQQRKNLQREVDKITQIGEKDAFKKNSEEKRKELEELKRALSREAMGAGNSTNSNQRIINDIGKSKPLIDWRYVLREAIKYDVDWSYKNAYVEDGVISANLEEQPMPETEIVLDTSGSINEVLLKNFLRECKNILKHSRLKVGCFDTKFYGFHEIRTEEDIENMKFEGGGGTNFDVAVSAFTRRVENKIIFTDGDANMPSTPIDAIWIVFGGIKINPIGGKVIQINEEQLDRLYNYQLINEVKERTKGKTH